jgi:hypothetical protein
MTPSCPSPHDAAPPTRPGLDNWVENLADSRDRFDYRRRVRAPATVSMWQSLGFGPNYKAAYCVAVCPAGEDVVFLAGLSVTFQRLTADARTWIRVLAKEASLAWALLRGKIRLRGSPRLLLAFARCFPS